MKHLQAAASILGFLFASLTIRAADLPPREKIEKDGWTFEFSPIDRKTAELLAGKVAVLERIRNEVQPVKIELESEVIEVRAGEFAKKLAELCALPERAGDFRREIGRMIPVVVEARTALQKATVLPRAVSIVRKSELIQRLQAGEKIPMFSYDAATNLVNFSFNFNFTIEKDYKLSGQPAALASIPLKQSEDSKQDSESAEALLKNFQEIWGYITSSVTGQMYEKMVVALGFNHVIGNVLSTEVQPDASALWVKHGASQWALRRIFVYALNPEQVESYLWYHEKQLQIAYRSTQRLNLEEKPENLSANQQAAAYAVFRTIAEKHGNEAVTKLLAAFWKLKPAQRTSQAFSKICAKQLKQPLSFYLPRGVVIEPVVEKAEK